MWKSILSRETISHARRLEEVEEMAHMICELEHQGRYHNFVWLGRSAVLML